MKIISSAALLLALGLAATPALAQTATGYGSIQKTTPSGKDPLTSGTMGKETQLPATGTNAVQPAPGTNGVMQSRMGAVQQQ